MSKKLQDIITRWSEMETLIVKEGPAMLADYLAAQYFESIVVAVKRCGISIDDGKAHEIASDIIYDFIKNEYRTIKSLDRNRGHLRGLFFKIIKAKLSRISKKVFENLENCQVLEKEDNTWSDLCMDLDAAIEKMRQQRPLIHKAFVLHYLKGRKLEEIGKRLDLSLNAVKQRLYNARRWLSDTLQEYNS